MLLVDLNKGQMGAAGSKTEIMAELAFMLHTLMTHEDGPQLDKEDIETIVRCAMMTDEERQAEAERVEREIKDFIKAQEEIARTAFYRDLVMGMVGDAKKRRGMR